MKFHHKARWGIKKNCMKSRIIISGKQLQSMFHWNSCWVENFPFVLVKKGTKSEVFPRYCLVVKLSQYFILFYFISNFSSLLIMLYNFVLVIFCCFFFFPKKWSFQKTGTYNVIFFHPFIFTNIFQINFLIQVQNPLSITETKKWVLCGNGNFVLAKIKTCQLLLHLSL